jgi:hypothetical protein
MAMMPDELPTAQMDLDREVLTARAKVWTVRGLRDRVSLFEPRILQLREIDMGTRETLDMMGGRLEELAQGMTSFGILIDLGEATGGTTADYRKYVPQFFDAMVVKTGGALKHVGVVFYGNPLTRVVTKFFIGRIAKVPMTVHKNRELALDAIRAAI